MRDDIAVRSSVHLANDSWPAQFHPDIGGICHRLCVRNADDKDSGITETADVAEVGFLPTNSSSERTILEEIIQT